MNERRWERWGAEAGIAAFVFGIIAFVVMGELPDQNASGKELISWAADNRDGVRLSLVFWALSSGCALFFLGALRSRISGAEGNHSELATAAVAGGLFAVLCGFVGGMLMAMTAWRDGVDMPAGTVQALWDGSNLTQTFGNAGFAVLAGALAAVVLATGMLPKWVGWYSAAVGALCVVSLFGMVMDSGAMAPMGAFQLAVALATFVDVLVVSVEMLRHAEAPMPAAQPA
jgi:hypothetical protein